MIGKFQGTVTQVREETPRVKTLRVAWPGIEHFSFVPGQFMQLSIPGFLTKANVPLKRSYSLASSPLDKGYVEFTITAKHPHGLSARLLQAKVGETILCDGPAGFFNLKRPVRDNTTFIGGGSGISSLRAMYRQLLLEGHRGPLTVLTGFHAADDFIYKDELAALQRDHPQFTVIPSITSDDASWTGEKGRITLLLPKLLTDAPNRDFYLCGPPDMVDDTINVLTGMGVPRHQMFREVW
jgi:NAD(P)H-flavin reductase